MTMVFSLRENVEVVRTFLVTKVRLPLFIGLAVNNSCF